MACQLPPRLAPGAAVGADGECAAVSRLVVVSNRVAPITEGEPTAGGLAAGVMDALKQTGGIWFGWSGEIAAGADLLPNPERPGSEAANPEPANAERISAPSRSILSIFRAVTMMSIIADLPMARCGRRCTTRSAWHASTGRSSPATAASMRCSPNRSPSWCTPPI